MINGGQEFFRGLRAARNNEINLSSSVVNYKCDSFRSRQLQLTRTRLIYILSAAVAVPAASRNSEASTQNRRTPNKTFEEQLLYYRYYFRVRK